MLGRRIARGGSGGFTVTDARSTFEISAAPQAGWAYGNAHRFSGYSYVGFANAAGGVRVAIVADDGSITSSTIATDGYLSGDQHNNPALIQRSDGKLLAIFCNHAGAAMYQRITTNSLATDPTISGGWGAITNIDSQLGSTAYTYPDLHVLSDGIYLFWRDSDGVSNWEWAKTTDDGATWSAFVNVAWATRAYGRMYGSGTRLDFVVSDGSYASEHANLFHFYRDGTTYHKSDGTAMPGGPPFDFADMTLVYDGSLAGTRGPGDIVRVGSEITVITDAQTGTPGPVIAEDIDYLFARWNGSAWNVEVLQANIGGITVDFTEGGAVLDPANPDRVIVSKRAVSDLAYPFHLYEYVTSNDGATWTITPISTTGDPDIYPTFVRGHTTALEYVWLKGTSVSETEFDWAIKGYGSAG